MPGQAWARSSCSTATPEAHDTAAVAMAPHYLFLSRLVPTDLREAALVVQQVPHALAVVQRTAQLGGRAPAAKELVGTTASHTWLTVACIT